MDKVKADNGMELMITGDFMELTGVTRNTLIHYDNLGLLKPVKTNERGDRFYNPFQFYTMQMIKLLQSSGISLENIKEFLDALATNSLGDLYSIFSEKLTLNRHELREEYVTAERAANFVKKISTVSEYFDRFIPNGVPIVEPVRDFGGGYHTFLVKKLSFFNPSYLNYCSKHVVEATPKLNDGAFPIVSICDGQDFLNGDYEVFAIGSLTFDKKYYHERDIKNAVHKYVLLRCIGNSDGLKVELDKVRRFIDENGYKLYSDIVIITNIYLVNEASEQECDRLICAPVVDKGYAGELKLQDRSNMQHDDYKEGDREEGIQRGQFIKLCKITRNALNHYEEHGLIGPKYVKENGYKMYGVRQVSAMLYIKSLKQAGFSVEEMREILNSDIVGPDKLYNRQSALRNKQHVIEEKLEKVLNMRSILRYLTKMLKAINAYQNKDGTIININHGFTHYIAVKESASIIDSFSSLTQITEYLNKMNKKKGVSFYPPIIFCGHSVKGWKAVPGITVTREYKGEDVQYLSGNYYFKFIENTFGETVEKLKESFSNIVNVEKREIAGPAIFMIMNVCRKENGEGLIKGLMYIPVK